VNRTAGFVGVVGGATKAQRPFPIRLQFSDPALDCHADSTLLDQLSLESQMGVDSYGEDSKRLPEHNRLLLPPALPEACPFAPDGYCSPNDHLNITLGNEEVGRLAFLPSLNRLQTLPLKWRSFQIIAGKRLACLQMELRLRGKPVRQQTGIPIYYFDLTLRSGTMLENTLANARGTASRWFRADRPGQSRLARHRPRRLRSQPS
jgi:hypothetical protein